MHSENIHTLLRTLFCLFLILNLAIKNASKILCVALSFAAARKIFEKKCSSLLARCLSYCQQNQIIQPTFFNITNGFTNVSYSTTTDPHDVWKLQSPNGKNDFTFFVNHFTAIPYSVV